MILKPGIHPGVSFADYLSIDACHNTTLQEFMHGRTPAHARYALSHPEKDTQALLIGHATHAAILEPERFEKEYCCRPKLNMRTNIGKGEAAKWDEDHAQQCSLSQGEHEAAVAMRKAVLEYPTSAELLGGKGANELTVIWADEPTGLTMKARVDRFTEYQGYPTVLDVKTTRGLAVNFDKAIVEYGYHAQAAAYLSGLAAIDRAQGRTPAKRRWMWIIVEKDEPHAVYVTEPEDPLLREGAALYRRALDTFAECQKSGKWPAYPVGVEVQMMKPWAFELTDPTQL